jgi:hypothetical protein
LTPGIDGRCRKPYEDEEHYTAYRAAVEDFG